MKAKVHYSDGIEVETDVVKYRSMAATVAKLIEYANSLWKTKHSQDDDTGGYRFSRDRPPKISKLTLDGIDYTPDKKK